MSCCLANGLKLKRKMIENGGKKWEKKMLFFIVWLEYKGIEKKRGKMGPFYLGLSFFFPFQIEEKT